MHTHRSFVLGAETEPCTFVKIKAATDHTVIPCVADDVAYGVLAEHSRDAPIPGVTPVGGAAGESVEVYGHGAPCEIIAGEDIDAGQTLKPDADGYAVVADYEEHYSAIAVAGAASGEKVKATVIRGVNPADPSP